MGKWRIDLWISLSTAGFPDVSDTGTRAGGDDPDRRRFASGGVAKDKGRKEATSYKPQQNSHTPEGHSPAT